MENSCNIGVRKPIPILEGFLRSLGEFGGKGKRTIFERLASLRQIRGVHDYVQEFKILVTQATPNGENKLLGYFLVGPLHDIQILLHLHDIKTSHEPWW